MLFVRATGGHGGRYRVKKTTEESDGSFMIFCSFRTYGAIENRTYIRVYARAVIVTQFYAFLLLLNIHATVWNIFFFSCC